MQAKVGDKISIDAKKVGQPRRGGVVKGTAQGLSGLRLTVAWDDGSTTTIAPGPGVLVVEGKGKAPKKAKPAAKKAAAKTPKKAAKGGKAKKKGSK